MHPYHPCVYDFSKNGKYRYFPIELLELVDSANGLGEGQLYIDSSPITEKWSEHWLTSVD
jgi:hypothetical protein